MNLILVLNPETEAKLKEQAALTGKRPEDLAVEALQEKLANGADSETTLPTSSRLAELEAWVASMPDGNPEADISRDSVYGVRGR